MRVLIYVAVLLVLTTAAAQAGQGNKIVVKNADGSVTEFVIPEDARGRPVSAAPAPRQTERKVEEKAAPKEDPAEIQDKAQASAPKDEEAAAVVKDDHEPDQKPAIEVKDDHQKPAQKPMPVAEKKEPEKKVVREASAPAAPKVPLPAHKPLLKRKVIETARKLPEGYAIPKNMAIAVAIKEAPPSKDFTVMRRVHEGVPVYAVVFDTADGPYVVMVNARNGALIDD